MVKFLMERMDVNVGKELIGTENGVQLMDVLVDKNGTEQVVNAKKATILLVPSALSVLMVNNGTQDLTDVIVQ